MSKPPKFHVGQAVVFVQAISAQPDPFETYPRLGSIYHVREVVLISGDYGLRLVEIKNPRARYADAIGEAAFWEERFAPVELLPDEALAQLLEETLAPVTT